MRKRWIQTAAISVGLVFLLTGCGPNTIPVLQPKGPVGREELGLIIFPFVLMAGVAAIVFAAFAWIMVKYRARPENADYVPPDTQGNVLLETIWTAIPVLIVAAIAIPTVIVTFRLLHPPKVDAKTLAAEDVSEQTVDVYVASATWKWLFDYPQYGIETVNHLVIPAGQPVDFQLTAIGPLNSFWVPSLGGMEMDMPGEDLGLWLESSRPGTFIGRSAQFSGKGFAHMSFPVTAETQPDFLRWVKKVKTTAPKLTAAEYKKLLLPTVVGQMDFSGDINPNRYNGSQYMTGMPGIASGMPIPGTVGHPAAVAHMPGMSSGSMSK